MPQPKHLDPSTYSADGGPIGVLLIHGLPGSVAETRPMGEYLAAQGLTVRCPLLAGHGTRPEDLVGIRWQVWADQVESVLCELLGRCEAVFAGGLSLGALLTLWLGAQRPEIDGLIAMAPSIKLRNPLMPITLGLRYLLKYLPSWAMEEEELGDPEAIHRMWFYDKTPLWSVGEVYLLIQQVRNMLGNIHQPILIFQGRLDNWLSPESARIIHDGVSSGDKTMVWLEHSGHNILVDGRRQEVWAQSHTWIMERV